MVLWAANFIVVKDIIDVLPPVGFTFLRYLLAAIALLVILRWSEGDPVAGPVSAAILLLGGLGLRPLPDALDGRPADDPGR